MSSVISGESRVSNRTNMSKASQGGSKVRSNSAYGQKKNAENQKKQEEAYYAMMEESRRNEEKHKALMRENLLRRKAKEQELSKAEEAKKAADSEVLNQRKNDIKEAYQKFLKNQDEPGTKSKPTSAKMTGDSSRRNQVAEERATRVTDHIFDQIEKFNHFEQPDTAGLLDALDISSSMYNLDKMLAKNEEKNAEITRRESTPGEIPELNTNKENEKSQHQPKKELKEPKSATKAAEPVQKSSKTPPPRQQDPKSAGLKDNSKPVNIQNAKKAASAKKIDSSPTEHIEEDINFGGYDDEEENQSIVSKKSEPKLVRIENLTKAEQLKNWEYQFLDSKANMKKKPQPKDLANEFEDIVNQGDGVFGWEKNVDTKPAKSEIMKKPTKPAQKRSVEPGVYYPAQQQQPKQPVPQKKPEKLNMQQSKTPPLPDSHLPPINKGSSAYKDSTFLPPLPEQGGKKQVVIETNIKPTQNVQKRTSQTPNASSNTGQGQGQKVIAPKAQPVGAADVRRQMNRRNNSRGKPVKSTVSTRDEDINVDEFLKYDLMNVNRQEAELQAELFRYHKQTSQQVKKIEEKYDICTQYKRTNDLINKQITYAGQNVMDEPEEDIEQSLVKLEELLSKQRNKIQSAPSGDTPVYPTNHKAGIDLDVFTFKNEIPRSQTSNLGNQQYPAQGKPPQPKPSSGKAPVASVVPPKNPVGPPPPQHRLARYDSREEYKRVDPAEEPVFEEEPEIEEDLDVKSNSSEEVEHILRGRAPAKHQHLQNEFDDDGDNSAIRRKPAGTSKTRSEVSHKPDQTESTTPRNDAKAANPANGGKEKPNSYAHLKEKKEKIKEQAEKVETRKDDKTPKAGDQETKDGEIKLNTKIDVHKLLFD